MTPPLPTEPYLAQSARWPRAGRHLLAHFDEQTVIVYQAYKPVIARYALEHRVFGGPEFSFSRMTWIKPNFLWMMFRSGWGTKPDQEMTLAIRLRRAFFDSLLLEAVPSSNASGSFGSEDEWRRAVAASSVRLQWDPDHDPRGNPLERRAIQLGVRGDVARRFATSEVVEIIDMSPFVEAEREHARAGDDGELRTPLERVYRPELAGASERVGLDEGVP